MEFDSYKKYLLPSVTILILANFLLNLIDHQVIGTISSKTNFLKLISFTISCLFFYLVSKEIKIVLNIFSNSLAISIFLLSFYFFDNLFLVFKGNLHPNFTVTLVSLLWIFLFIINKRTNSSLIILIVYIFMRMFNSINFSYLKNSIYYRELNYDVIYQWFPITEKIYINGLYDAYLNNVIPKQGLVPSHIQSTIHKLLFNTSSFEFIQITSSIFLLFFLFLINDLNISKKNKILISILFFSLIFNNQWLYYLLVNSLMIEGVVSFLFSSIILNYKKLSEFNKGTRAIYLLSFGYCVLTKQFVSLLCLIIFFISFLILKEKMILVTLFPLIFDFLVKMQLKINPSFITHNEDLDFLELIQNLLLLNNIKFDNIVLIFSNFYNDKPFTIIFIIFIISNLYVIWSEKNFYSFENIYFYISVINLFFILVLYTTYWQNAEELESSYRYIVNLIGLYFISIATNFEKIENVNK